MELSNKITYWIREKVREAGAEGGVLGLSGGVDSSVAAVLCKRALPDKTLGLIMPCESQISDKQDALLLAEKFNIETKQVQLDPIYQRFREKLPSGNSLALANLKPRLRMTTLYYFANNLNYLVIGTSNKSEIMVGYFTKYGDGGADILPLGGLLKIQVQKLAEEVGIPEKIRNKPPSAGLWRGQIDEKEVGLSYEQLDKAIVAIESGKEDSVEPEVMMKTKRLMQASKHKRKPALIFEE